MHKLPRRKLLTALSAGLYVPPALRELPAPGSYAAVSPSLGQPKPMPVAPSRRKPIPPRTGDGGLADER